MPRRVTDDWTTLDPATTARALRDLAGLTPTEAAAALGLPPGPGSVSTVTSREQRERDGTYRVSVTILEQRAQAWGLELRIQARRVRR
jgi:hypothetical protein